LALLLTRCLGILAPFLLDLIHQNLSFLGFDAALGDEHAHDAPY